MHQLDSRVLALYGTAPLWLTDTYLTHVLTRVTWSC